MAHMLPAGAGIGSNDREALEQAQRADRESPPHKPAKTPALSPVVKNSPGRRSGDGWRKGVGPGFPSGV